jgi:hypothetical protein
MGFRIRASMPRLAATAILVGAGLFAPLASAATLVDFSGDKKAAPYLQESFAFDGARIVNGNCVSNGCLALNDNEATTMTNMSAPNLFTLSGLSFSLLGNGTGNFLKLDGSNGTSLIFALKDFAKNAYHTLVFGDEFANVSSVAFSTGGGGNVRLDDIGATPTPVPTPAPVPLPAAAWLLLAGIGALAATRRRARAAA